MSTVKTYDIQAELSQAAYGIFLDKVIATTELTNSDTADMSSSQAAAFVEKWQVVAQSPYSSTGLSATVFEEINSGKKYLAIRGTEPTGSDLTADGLLAAGLPSNFNPQFIALKALLEEHWLVDGTLDGPFTVTGHSLGGYLAAAVKQSYSQVTEAYLYNAPGVGGLLGNLADAIGSALGLSTLSSDNIWNLRSSEGFPVIAGLGYQLGSPVSIQTEKSLNNHGISLLADSLAVYGAYAQAAPNLTQSQLNSLIDAFGTSAEISSNSKTLEAALDALRFIVSGPTASKTEIGNRGALYENLNNTAFKAKLSEWANTTQFTLLADKSILHADPARGKSTDCRASYQ